MLENYESGVIQYRQANDFGGLLAFTFMCSRKELRAKPNPFLDSLVSDGADAFVLRKEFMALDILAMLIGIASVYGDVEDGAILAQRFHKELARLLVAEQELPDERVYNELVATKVGGYWKEFESQHKDGLKFAWLGKMFATNIGKPTVANAVGVEVGFSGEVIADKKLVSDLKQMFTH